MLNKQKTVYSIDYQELFDKYRFERQHYIRINFCEISRRSYW